MPHYVFADIFFAVASLGFILIVTLFVWGSILIIGIVQDVRHISRRARQESDRIVDDVDDLRSEIKKESKHITHFFHSLGMIFSKTAQGKKAKK